MSWYHWTSHDWLGFAGCIALWAVMWVGSWLSTRNTHWRL